MRSRRPAAAVAHRVTRPADMLRPLIGPVLLAGLAGAAAAVLALLAGQPADPAGYNLPGALGVQNYGQGDLDIERFTIEDITDGGDGLLPGTGQARRLLLTNPNDFEVSLTDLTVTVGTPVAAAGRPVDGCTAGYLHVEPLDRAVLVPGSGSTEVALTVRLAADSPDACQGVHFPLTYSATVSAS